jgi:hypothetical protein
MHWYQLLKMAHGNIIFKPNPVIDLSQESGHGFW